MTTITPTPTASNRVAAIQATTAKVASKAFNTDGITSDRIQTKLKTHDVTGHQTQNNKTTPTAAPAGQAPGDQFKETSIMASPKSLLETLSDIGDRIADHGKTADLTEQFASANYDLLKEHHIFSAMVPTALGGQGVAYPDMCEFLRQLAGYHPSTALSFSMHQHIIAANLYNHQHGKPGQALLEKVAANELALVSTGAGDWLASNGELTRTEGGYLFSGIKHFASGSVAGNVLVTSAPFEDPQEGWQVFHFPVPMNAEGVSVLDNWHPLGMKGTGSNSVKLENVFVPDAAIAVKRPRGDFHQMWATILPVALPLIMSVYRGVAEKAQRRAMELCRNSTDPVTPYLLGEMENALTTAQLAVDDMIRIVDDFRFSNTLDTVNAVVQRKTIAAEACKVCVAKALEACGGFGFMQAGGIESLFRDVMASHFHPLQEKRQLLFTGSLAQGKEPPSQAF
ncbi:acyl-CoA/acyl-ACP dehydrogenase [Aestuariicella hydrocarbonica]|uniref:Acyl-CoA/acyl-ACP dehydrogenase n=1 Tax=Pseudomaricurvus hydrocarbonicus TaxID=1470433 RepID=A0A9E5JSC6_9GAMM|nr:acyl-CoA dehydrogenase family protein [Aestuariicella hydrocarbonica]NHO65937.1 acyl-CoA/acyl-ACP dehydrogenase [Aestuariicella hydrocarbonica]